MPRASSHPLEEAYTLNYKRPFFNQKLKREEAVVSFAGLRGGVGRRPGLRRAWGPALPLVWDQIREIGPVAGAGTRSARSLAVSAPLPATSTPGCSRG
jgi:hypothetical protein